jgi:hypothetical protein
MAKEVNAIFVEEKDTKNCVRFQEELSDLGAPVIGTLYVQKYTLNQMGYKRGQKLEMTLKVEE